MNMIDIEDRARAIKLMVLDVDGVLTDGKLYFSDDGREYKAFNSKDGHGIVMLQMSGVKVSVITARNSPVVAKRMKELRMEHVVQGRTDKRVALMELLDTMTLKPEQVAYVGDDVVDLGPMRVAGLAVAVADAHELAKQQAHWITTLNGGHGAVREVCDLIMQAQNTLGSVLERHDM